MGDSGANLLDDARPVRPDHVRKAVARAGKPTAHAEIQSVEPHPMDSTRDLSRSPARALRQLLHPEVLDATGLGPGPGLHVRAGIRRTESEPARRVGAEWVRAGCRASGI